MNLKRSLLFILFFLAGVFAGSIIASAVQGVPSLQWLAFSKSVGISPSAPFVLDLSIIKLSLGFEINVSVAHIITVILALLAYIGLKKKL